MRHTYGAEVSSLKREYFSDTISPSISAGCSRLAEQHALAYDWQP